MCISVSLFQRLIVKEMCVWEVYLKTKLCGFKYFAPFFKNCCFKSMFIIIIDIFCVCVCVFIFFLIHKGRNGSGKPVSEVSAYNAHCKSFSLLHSPFFGGVCVWHLWHSMCVFQYLLQVYCNI